MAPAAPPVMPGLLVRLARDGGARPEVVYSGTGRVARVMIGRTPAEVVDALGRVFAICPAAQQLAGRLALDGADGVANDPEEIATLGRASQLESLREHVLRISLAWPAALGEVPDRDAALRANVAARGDAVDDAVALAERDVFGCAADEWLADGDTLADWAARGRTLAARFIGRALTAEWPSAPAEPAATLAARHAAHRALAALAPGSVAAFHAARLADLASLALALRAGDSDPPRAEPDGAGGARVTVRCSRGDLTHVARVAQGRVSGYTILSPTDAAFAEDGFGRRWLDAVEAVPDDRREAALHAIVAALDPCTDCRIEVG